MQTNRTVTVSLLLVLAVGWLILVLDTRTARAVLCDQLFKLLADDGEPNETFGFSVAINNNVALVGAVCDDVAGSCSGSAYLFNAAGGEQLFKLVPDDGAAGDWFGNSVGISGNTAIVGSYQDDDRGDFSGAAYLFDVATGAQRMKLFPADGASNDQFGQSVAIGENVAIVGAPFDDDRGNSAGSAYLYDVSTGSQLAKLFASDAQADDRFGISVAISGNTAIVGAYEDTDLGSDAGSAYLFDVKTGAQIAKLLPEDGDEYDHFGFSVAISGNIALVGAYKGQLGPLDEPGAAYVFDVATGTQIAQFLPFSDSNLDLTGWSVGVSGSVAVIGAPRDDDRGNNAGAAYLISVVPEPASIILATALLAAAAVPRRS
ncbi:MAG TPA: FG-GAP repeat protein [Lacipirellulaceae bacterium]